MSDWVLKADGVLHAGGRKVACVIGRSGRVQDKREGDGATPIGRFALRYVLYRPDRVAPPKTGLPIRAILPDDLWCDAPDHPLYNRPTRKPFTASAEDMWRKDHVYDLVVVTGHNDDPVVPYLGSAIFIHLPHDDGRPTAGCVALPRDDLLHLLAQTMPGDGIVIEP